LRIDYAIVSVILTGAGLFFPQCCAAGQTLECTGVEESHHFTLRAVPVAYGLEKIVLTGPSGIRHEYLVEGVKKIPVGDERALFGSLISAHVTGKQHELLLGPDSYFEMYAAQDRDRPPGSANTVFFFDHQKPASEILDLKTGKRIREEHLKQGRIPFRCGHFPEYLQYIEHRDSVTASTGMASSRILEKRMQGLAGKFASAYVDQNLVFDNRFLGVEVWQNPFDMWVFQQMITELKPDVIIETGTAHGGSALFFATILEKINPYGRIITVEIDPGVDSNVSKARSFPVFSERVRIIKGDSVSNRTLTQVQDLVDELETDKNARNGSSERQNLTVLVTLDSLHSAEHVLEELRLYSRFVSNGSYIVVQDTIIDQNPKFIDWFVRPWAKGSVAGPAQAVREFLEESPDFQRDKRWEKYYFTFYPGGFLKKIR
jgi:cephalosporin hydroxylase